jgi:hypothetical protein
MQFIACTTDRGAVDVEVLWILVLLDIGLDDPVKALEAPSR